MPIRIQSNRPYYPRIYPMRPAAQPRVPAGRGTIAPGGIDTSPTGSIGGDLIKAIGNQMQMNRQNAAANALMNTQTPPRAGAVGPVLDPQTMQQVGAITPTAGTAPQTGGMGELQMRQQQAQQDAAQRTADLNAQYKRAQIAEMLARTQGRTAGATKPTKPAPYVAGSGDVQNDPATDNFNQISADFDAQHGKGSYSVFTRNLSNLQPDGKGNLVLMRPATADEKKADPNTPDNVPVTDKNGLPQYSIPATDAGYWSDRYNAARIRGGQDRLGPMPDGVNQNSGDASGSSQINPIAVKTNLAARALPDGTWIQLPDGSTRQITRSAAQPQPAATPGTVTTAPPAASDTSGTEQSTDQTDQTQN